MCNILENFDRGGERFPKNQNSNHQYSEIQENKSYLLNILFFFYYIFYYIKFNLYLIIKKLSGSLSISNNTFDILLLPKNQPIEIISVFKGV